MRGRPDEPAAWAGGRVSTRAGQGRAGQGRAGPGRGGVSSSRPTHPPRFAGEPSFHTAKKLMAGFHSRRRYMERMSSARAVKLAARLVSPSSVARAAIPTAWVGDDAWQATATMMAVMPTTSPTGNRNRKPQQETATGNRNRKAQQENAAAPGNEQASGAPAAGARGGGGAGRSQRNGTQPPEERDRRCRKTWR